MSWEAHTHGNLVPCRFVVADHMADDAYVVATVERGSAGSDEAADSWLAATAAAISALAGASDTDAPLANGHACKVQQRQQQQQRGPASAAEGSAGPAATANGLHRGPEAAPGCAYTPQSASRAAPASCNGAASAERTQLQQRHSKQQYLENIRACLQAS